MTTPEKVKMDLEARLLALAQGGHVPCITGIHSVVVEDNAAHIAFDLEGQDTPLHFEVALPVELVSKAELPAFACWLATPSVGTLQ